MTGNLQTLSMHGFFEGWSETRLAHATLGSQTPFAVLAPASLLEPGVDFAPAEVALVELALGVVEGAAPADLLRVGHRPLPLLLDPVLVPIVPGCVVMHVLLVDGELFDARPRGGLQVHLEPAQTHRAVN